MLILRRATRSFLSHRNTAAAACLRFVHTTSSSSNNNNNKGQVVHDAYPSRVAGSQGRKLPRVDPVVWTPKDEWSRQQFLTEEQLAEFDANGYLVLRQVFDRDELQQAQHEVNTLREEHERSLMAGGAVDDERAGSVVTQSSKTVTEPDTGVLKSIFAPHEISTVLRRATTHRDVVGAVRELLADDVYVHQSRVNFQRGFVGRGFNWHSDFETWHVEDGMPRARAVSTVVLLEANLPVNGPLMIVPGSHRHFVSCAGETPKENWTRSLKHQEVGVPDEAIVAELCRTYGINQVLGEPGDVVIFDCNCLHASNSNISPFPRVNLFTVFNAASNALVQPFGDGIDQVRPEHIAHRNNMTIVASE
eukprot:TRINITY_DN66890_c6_g7_i2.p1 TRINITY_DN66890_c6_g7~~TRINITY_DN66890_c6_g7_i2.p1  ORF type:complete len:379 (-),score=190.16 TRINITY_DN66890_c6_g7_i2:346-1431(-)